MKNKDFISELRDCSADKRIKFAKEIIYKLTDRVTDVVDLSAVCDHFVYCDTLSSQIPRSYAGHAFDATKQALFQQLIIRAVALWDKPDLGSGPVKSLAFAVAY